MNREDIIRMALEAGAATGSPAPNAPEIIFTQCLDVERFAALVAAAQREACAKVIDDFGPTLANGAMLAEAIRARGQA